MTSSKIMNIATISRSSLGNCQTKILAFSTCFSIVLLLAFVVLFLLQMILVGLWSNVYQHLNISMPKTFAWDFLIRFFGSTFDDCLDHSDPERTAVYNLASQATGCMYYYSTPLVIIVGIILSIGMTIIPVFYVVEKFCLGLSSNFALNGTLLFAILHVAFGIRNVFMYCIYFGNNDELLENLKRSMNNYMSLSSSLSKISPKWNLAQISNKCCGITNFTNWEFDVFKWEGNPKYPHSCCDYLTNSTCKVYPTRREVFLKGCLDPELDTINQVSATALWLTFTGVATSLFLIFLLFLASTIYESGSGSSICRFTRHPQPSIKTRENIDDMFSNQERGQDATKHECKELTVRRHSKVHVSLNSWGMAFRTQSQTLSKIHLPKKETPV